MLNLIFIPEIILSIGAMLIILVDLFFQKQKGMSFILIQFLLLIAAYYSLNNQTFPKYSAYTLDEFTNIIKEPTRRINLIILVNSLSV